MFGCFCRGASCGRLTLWLYFSTVKECVENLNQEEDEEKLVSSLWGAERCLRVLESVSAAEMSRFEA